MKGMRDEIEQPDLPIGLLAVNANIRP